MVTALEIVTVDLNRRPALKKFIEEEMQPRKKGQPHKGWKKSAIERHKDTNPRHLQNDNK